MLFLFFKYQIFCPELFGYAQNQLYEKAKVNSKIYSWKTKLHETYYPMSQEVKAIK